MGFFDGGISGLFGLVGGAISSGVQAKAQREANETNLKIARETNQANLDIAQMNNDYNQKQFEKQIAYNWDMWNANNEYNTAANQAARFKEAGLNPAMMMGSGNAGTASSAGSVSPPTASPVTMQGSTVQPVDGWSKVFENMAGLAQMVEGIRGMRADNAIKDAEALFAKRKFLAEVQRMESEAKSGKARAKVDEKYSEMYDTILDNEITQKENDIAIQGVQKQILDTQLFMEDYRAMNFPQQLTYEMARITAEVQGIKEANELTREQVAHEVSKRINTIINAYGYEFANNKDKQRILKAIIDNLEFSTSNAYNSALSTGFSGLIPTFNDIPSLYEVITGKKRQSNKPTNDKNRGYGNAQQKWKNKGVKFQPPKKTIAL